MKHCCVIGGSGFIGSHVVKLLAATNRKITVIGRKAVHPGELPQNAGYIQGDYADRNFLTCALHGVTEVIDLAYATVPQTSFKDPIYDIFSNLPSAINLFESVIANKVQRLILISSGGTVYGKAIHIPIGEDHVTNPISPYGITKLAVEKYARMYGEINSCPFVCIRPGNAFGEGQEPFVGQGFISTAIASILLQKEIPLFGESGTIRDYIYVEDLAKGILAALEKGKNGSFYIFRYYRLWV